MNELKRIGLILLAAGESKRLGTPKQAVLFDGESLLRRAARAAVGSKCTEIAAVLGAGAEMLRKEVDGLDLEVALNRDWQTGIGSSIRAGLEKLFQKSSDLDAVVITVCDQPNLTSAVIDGLIRKFNESNALIVASAYAGTLGVPALFDRSLFSALESLKHDRGAKSVILDYPEQAVAVDFPGGEIDIDTVEDLNRF